MSTSIDRVRHRVHTMATLTTLTSKQTSNGMQASDDAYLY
jgi:hypothetical protein